MFRLIGWLLGFIGAAIIVFALSIAVRWAVYFCRIIRRRYLAMRRG